MLALLLLNLTASLKHMSKTEHTIADFRSDTVTRPTQPMLEAMMAAPVGDDVYRDDPTTNALEEKIAALLGFEAAVFMPSGTQSNLAGVMTHCGRGDEYIIGKSFHIYAYEAGGTAILGSVFPHPLDVSPRGALSPDDIVSAVKQDDSHFPVTRLVCIENTADGCVHDADYMDAIADTAHRCGLKAHCDGARIFNAAVALDVEPERLVRQFDTLSICLSKGLGTPAGSVLLGSHEAVTAARRMRKMLGGGMRQTGILAAAGIFALDHNIKRLAEDHERAARLAETLENIDGILVRREFVETNMIFFEFDERITDEALRNFEDYMLERGVLVLGGREVRLVLHLDIDDRGCEALVAALTDFINAC